MEESKTTFQRCVERYFQYRLDIQVPMSRKWNGWDGRAMRQILAYLLELTGNDEEKAYAGWDYILSNIDRGTPFHQRISLHLQTMVKYIPEIIAVLNPYGKLGKTKQERARTDREAYRKDLAARLGG
jgi:hypothetical protein